MPAAQQKLGLVAHRLWRPVETADQFFGVGVRTFDPDHQQVLGQGFEDRIAGVFRIDPFADRSARIADEVRVVVEGFRTRYEMRSIHKRRDLGGAKLFLPGHIFVKRQAALLRIARLAEVSRNWREIGESDVGSDISSITSDILGISNQQNRYTRFIKAM